MANRNHSGTTLGIISIVISLIVLALLSVVLFNIESIGTSTDYSSLLVGALALIVTVLIGFQITSIIQFDKRFESFEKKTEHEIEDSLHNQTKLSVKAAKMAENDAIGTALMMLAWSFVEKGEIDSALRTLINSLRAFQSGNLKDPMIVSEMHDVEDSLISIAETDKGHWFFRDIDEKNVFIDTVMKIQDRERMNKLLDFFYRFGVVEPIRKSK